MELDFDVPARLGRHAQLYHVGIACHRLEPAMEQIGKVFGVSWTPIADDSAPNLFTPEGPSYWSARRTHAIGSLVPFELLEGNPGSTWDTPKLALTHHVAYWSPDVGADVAALQIEGWSIEIAMMDPDGNPTEFAYMLRQDAIRVELVDVRRRAAYLALTAQSRDD